MEIDLPGIVAEVCADFERYEGALRTNDVATFNSMFHKDSRIIRYGGNENLYGYDQIEGFVLRGRQPDLRARDAQRGTVGAAILASEARASPPPG